MCAHLIKHFINFCNLCRLCNKGLDNREIWMAHRVLFLFYVVNYVLLLCLIPLFHLVLQHKRRRHKAIRQTSADSVSLYEELANSIEEENTTLPIPLPELGGHTCSVAQWPEFYNFLLWFLFLFSFSFYFHFQNLLDVTDLVLSSKV